MLEDLIADRVSPMIVDFFKKIDVHDHHGYREVTTFEFSDDVRRVDVERLSAEKAGHRIARGGILKLIGKKCAFGDVPGGREYHTPVIFGAPSQTSIHAVLSTKTIGEKRNIHPRI